MIRVFCTPVFIVLLSFLADFSCRADIVNGDFEIPVPINGTGGGWTSSGVNFGGWQASSGNPAGHMLLNLNGVGDRDPVVQQTLTNLVAGREYQVTWDYLRHVGSQTHSFGVFLDTQTDPLLLDNSKAIFLGENLAGGWATEIATFVATSTTHELFFAAELDNRTNGGNGVTDTSYRLDNVSLAATGVPEPASAIIPCLLLGAFLRRRR